MSDKKSKSPQRPNQDELKSKEQKESLQALALKLGILSNKQYLPVKLPSKTKSMNRILRSTTPDGQYTKFVSKTGKSSKSSKIIDAVHAIKPRGISV